MTDPKKVIKRVRKTPRATQVDTKSGISRAWRGKKMKEIRWGQTLFARDHNFAKAQKALKDKRDAEVIKRDNISATRLKNLAKARKVRNAKKS